MALILSDPRVDAIMRFIRSHRDGASVAEIRAQLTAPPTRRTVQNWLNAMVGFGALAATGKTRLRRYHLRTSPGVLGTVTWRDDAGPTASDAAARPNLGTRQSPKSVLSSQPVRSPSEAAPSSPRPSKTSARPVERSTDGASAAPAPTSELLPQLPSVASISAARIPAVLERVLPNLLRLRITPDRVLPELKLPATADFILRPGERVEDLATVVTAALDRLTATQAARYEMAAADFARWRAVYWPAGDALTPRLPYVPLPPLALPRPMAPERLTLFLREVSYVVNTGMKPEQLPAYLETQTGWLRGSETIDDWKAVLTAELNRLRLEDALQRNIRAEKYRAWRVDAWPMKAPA